MSDQPPSLDDAAGWQREAQQWREKYEKLSQQFNEFCGESKELENELDTQLEQSQQSNKRLENELSMLKRQFADLRLQKSTADAEHARTLAPLRASLQEAQQKCQQQITYIARLETETDELTTHKRVLEQSVHDYADKVETLEEQRAMCETQLHFQKSAHDEIVQRLRDRIRELEEDMNAHSAVNNVPDAMQIADNDDNADITDSNGSHLNYLTPLRPAAYSSEQNKNNKRIKSSPAGKTPPLFVADTKATSHSLLSPPRPADSNAKDKPADSSDDVLHNYAMNDASPRVALSFRSSTAAISTASGRDLSVSDGGNPSLGVENSQNVCSSKSVEYMDDENDEEHDYGYSSTPTSDKQQSSAKSSLNNSNKKSATNGATDNAVVACADVAASTALAEPRCFMPNSKTLTGLNSGDAGVAQSNLKSPEPNQLKICSRKSLDMRSLRTGSVDETNQQLARKSLCPSSNTVMGGAHQRLMSLPGGSVVSNINIVNNNSQHLSSLDENVSASADSTARSHDPMVKTAALQQVSRLPQPQSGIAVPASTNNNNNNVHVSWFRSMQLVDKALLKLNALEKNVKQTNTTTPTGGSSSGSSSSVHFTSTTEKKKISSSSPSPGGANKTKSSNDHHHHMQNHMPRLAAGDHNIIKKQRSVTDGTVVSNSGQFCVATENIGGGFRSDPMFAAVNNNNNNIKNMLSPPQRDAKFNGIRASKLAAPMQQPPICMQPRAASSSSQSSTLSSVSSRNSEKSLQSTSSTSSIPAPSKLGGISIRNFSHNLPSNTNANDQVRLRSVSALPPPSMTMLTTTSSAMPPPSFVPKLIRQPNAVIMSGQQQQQPLVMRQPYYHPPGAAAPITNAHVTLGGAGVDGKQQQQRLSSAMKQQT